MIASNIRTSIHMIVMLSIATIIANADQADVNQCIDQIKYAFRGASTAIGCLRYALEHYVKSQVISINKEDSSKYSSEKTASNVKTAVHQNVPNEPRRVNSFTELMDGTRAGQSSSSQSSSNSIQDFQRQSSFNSNEDNQSQTGSNIIQDFQSQSSSSNSQDIPSSSQDIQSSSQDAQNYAKAYYNELGTMIDSKYVPKIREFCREFYMESYWECFVELLPFGGWAKTAVKNALYNYKLALIPKESFTYAYMQCIIRNSFVLKISKSPTEFCERFKN